MTHWGWRGGLAVGGGIFLVMGITGSLRVTMSRDGLGTIHTSTDTSTGTLIISPYGAEDKINDFLLDTDYELVGWQYQITYSDTVTILRRMAQLGIELFFILENNVYGGGSRDFATLLKKASHTRLHVKSDDHLGTVYQHAKVFVRDRKDFLISSANVSYPSFWKNREYRFIGTNTGIAQNLYDLFQKDRRGEPLTAMDIHPSLVVCPIDCREKIIHALQTAQSSILVEMQYIEDPEIIEMLVQKSRDIHVRIIVGEYQNKELLAELGDAVKILNDPYLHAKEILIDEMMLIHGSMNFSTNGLDNNREIGIIIDYKPAIHIFKSQFEKDRGMTNGLSFSRIDEDERCDSSRLRGSAVGNIGRALCLSSIQI